MIRRTLTGGLLATVAMLALVPTAADAAPAAPASRTAAVAVAPHLRPTDAVNLSPTYNRSYYTLGRVTTSRSSLNVRSGPGTGYRVTGSLRAGQLVALSCRTQGSRVHGTRQWYRLTRARGYVSAHYARVRGALPWC
ncbi:SH3 domain-containing protein [Streptomyces sp. NPDC047017]|uniref:SH3 domain-containing protein n=1 Tax=Streptomyces sp. NPDC047017 TaxID=3155024 RepID=UPI0033DA926B